MDGCRAAVRSSGRPAPWQLPFPPRAVPPPGRRFLGCSRWRLTSVTAQGRRSHTLCPPPVRVRPHRSPLLKPGRAAWRGRSQGPSSARPSSEPRATARPRLPRPGGGPAPRPAPLFLRVWRPSGPAGRRDKPHRPSQGRRTRSGLPGPAPSPPGGPGLRRGVSAPKPSDGLQPSGGPVPSQKAQQGRQSPQPGPRRTLGTECLPATCQTASVSLPFPSSDNTSLWSAGGEGRETNSTLSGRPRAETPRRQRRGGGKDTTGAGAAALTSVPCRRELGGRDT